MTREETISILEESKRQNEIMRDNPSTFWASHQMADGVKNAKRRIEALDHALSATRPVSREQVEKVWTGCDICGGDKKIKSDNFCGAATMRIVGDSIDLRGDEKKIKFFGHIYAPSFSVKFCPFCGKPLTDEAVDIRLKELEALKDDQT